MSELSSMYIPTCRVYHCYREWNEMICKPVAHPDVPLHAPYTDAYCVREGIPLCLDKWILHYQSLPSHIHIVGK